MKPERQTLNGGESLVYDMVPHYYGSCYYCETLNGKHETGCRPPYDDELADSTIPVPSLRHISDSEINAAIEPLKG